jgi:hypothetical protein
LASGHYKVEFSPELESSLNYVTQYYKEKSSLATAEPVKVLQKKTTEKINAELQVGGEIEGVVTDAWTHAPLAGVYVFAIGSGEAFAGVAQTNASGQYAMLGLASGISKIEFVDLASGSPYIAQYYDDEPSLASVTGGTTVSKSVVLSEVVHRHWRRSSDGLWAVSAGPVEMNDRDLPWRGPVGMRKRVRSK